VVEFERGKVVRDELQGAYIEQHPVRDEELWGGTGYGATYPGGRGRGF
jgi:hypothetical protein